MKTAKTFFGFFIILTLLFTLPGFAFQKNGNAPEKATAYNVGAPDHGPNNTANAILKDTGFTVIKRDTSFMYIDTRYKKAMSHIKARADSAKAYAKANNFNPNYVFLVDMSIPSGKKRFFVYNIKKDSLECSSLVAHGYGSTVKGSDDKLLFSNENYSYRTSLGRYKIGNSYNGSYGLAYKLYGLDSTNSRAFERTVVLHSDYHVPSGETYPYAIFQSAGCPTVAPSFLPILGKYIKGSQKPILLWIYY
jgi:hypothetical protein